MRILVFIIPDDLWESVANQYQGHLTGKTLSEVGQTSLGRLKNENDQKTGYGSLIPLTRPMKMTRGLTGYILEPLTVVKIVVDSPGGMLGGSNEIDLRPARLSRCGVEVRPDHIPMYVGVRVFERGE